MDEKNLNPDSPQSSADSGPQPPIFNNNDGVEAPMSAAPAPEASVQTAPGLPPQPNSQVPPQPQPQPSPDPTAPSLPSLDSPVAEPNPPTVDLPATEPNPPTETPDSKPTINKKLLILIGGIVGGLLVILLVLFLIILPIFGVSRAEYNEAYKTASNAESSLVQTTSPILSYYGNTETTLKNEMDRFDKSYKLYQTEFAKLTADSKPIKNDANAKQLYDKVVKQNQEFDTAVKTIHEAYDKILPKFVGIDNFNTGDAAKFVAALEALTEVEYSLNQTFVDSALPAARHLQSTAQAYEADYNSYDAYSAAQTSFDNVFKDWASNMERLMEESNPSDELAELVTYFSEKS